MKESAHEHSDESGRPEDLHKQLSASIGSRVQNAANFFGRLTSSVGVLLVDRDIRKKAFSMVVNEAQKGYQDFQGKSDMVHGQDRVQKQRTARSTNFSSALQGVLQQIENQIQELRRNRDLARVRQAKVDVQVGRLVLVGVPQGIRTALWIVVLEAEYLLRPLRPLQRPTQRDNLHKDASKSLTGVNGKDQAIAAPLPGPSDMPDQQSGLHPDAASTLDKPVGEDNVASLEVPEQNVQSEALPEVKGRQEVEEQELSGLEEVKGHKPVTVEDPSCSSSDPYIMPAEAGSSHTEPGEESAVVGTNPSGTARDELHYEATGSVRHSGNIDKTGEVELTTLSPKKVEQSSSQQHGSMEASGSGALTPTVGSKQLSEVAMHMSPSSENLAASVWSGKSGAINTSRPGMVGINMTHVMPPSSVSGHIALDSDGWEILEPDTAHISGREDVEGVIGQVLKELSDGVYPLSSEEREATQMLASAMLIESNEPSTSQRGAYPEDCRFAMLVSMTAGQEEVDDVIGRDIARTFPEHPQFGTSGQSSLFRLLKAYSLHDLEVGYCQGMAFMAGVCLMYLDEEPAFRLYCRLMDPDGPNLRRLYLPGLEALKTELAVIEFLILQHLPHVSRKLEAMSIPAVLYASQWVMTVFASPFPPEFCARIMDIMLQDGNDLIMVRVALAIMDELADGLIATSDFESAITHLKVSPLSWNRDVLRTIIDRALIGPVTQQQLEEAALWAAKEVLRTYGDPSPHARAHGDVRDPASTSVETDEVSDNRLGADRGREAAGKVDVDGHDLGEGSSGRLGAEEDGRRASGEQRRKRQVSTTDLEEGTEEAYDQPGLSPEMLALVVELGLLSPASLSSTQRWHQHAAIEDGSPTQDPLS